MYLINNCQVIVIINPHLLNMSTNDYMYKDSNKNIFKKNLQDCSKNGFYKS